MKVKLSEYPELSHNFREDKSIYDWDDFSWEDYVELVNSIDNDLNENGHSSCQNIYSDNTNDLDFGQLNEQFQRNDEDELPEVGLRSRPIGYIYDGSYQVFGLIEKHIWDDDSKPSEIDRKSEEQWESFISSGDVSDPAFEKLNELSSGVDDCNLYEEDDIYFRAIAGIGDVSLDSSPKPSNIGLVSGLHYGSDEYSRIDYGDFFDEVSEINGKLRQLTCKADEPEEEEENLYLRCRKDAIKMDSAAKCHLNKGLEYILGGDEISAKKYLEKVTKEKEASKRLHAEAAREILSIKNKNNGIMKLDLHYLHVAEAIQAVKERLHTIENQGLAYSDEHLLEVITGRGKHSSGAPKLPGAVRSFLEKNGYHFDGSRPGVIMVQPKVLGGWD